MRCLDEELDHTDHLCCYIFLNLLSSSILHFQRNEKIEKPESGIELG